MLGVPVLYNSNRNSKDATKDFKITYSWAGNNDQQIGNVIYIYKNSDNSLIYNEQFTNYYKQEITVPANTLTNGVQYKVSVAVITSEGTSTTSEPMLFYCYTTPTFEFSNVENEQIIQNDTYEFELSYNQTEGEELEEYYVTLYASDQTAIYTSDVSYNTESLSVTISGLENNTQYYIKAFGQTLTGMSIETQSIHITVRYLQPAIYNLVELTNNFHGGYITIKSNITSLRGRVYKNGEEIDATFVDNEYVDVTDLDSILKFNEDFNLSNNFTLMLKGFGFTRNTYMLTMSNGVYKLYVYYRIGSYDSTNGVEKAYFEVRVEGAITYTITSNYIDVPANVELVGFMLSKQNSYYEIVAYNYKTPAVDIPSGIIQNNRLYDKTSEDSMYNLMMNNDNKLYINNNQDNKVDMYNNRICFKLYSNNESGDAG